MSHEHEPIICPNCGYPAVKNYCAQCGQETHPHNESFWGLVMHFVGHYFHYDSKFWQTMKALWFSPGKLTTAYWNNQRMRYIPPVSLYIFISAVYFLCASAFGHKNDNGNGNFLYVSNNGRVVNNVYHIDSTHSNVHNDFVFTADTTVSPFLNKQFHKIEHEYGGLKKYLDEQVLHNIPKVFFLMIPFMAFILKLLFARRKDMLFLHHAIFSLHYHSLWFSVFFITEISPFHKINNWLWIALLPVVYIYMIKALRNAYHIGMGRAIAYTWIIAFLYGLIFSLTFLAYFLLSVVWA
ncbi:MAG: hypothetical protein JWQ38_2862 [Flavipsychrobacter sp.]|nr:hypothetical protein [Flavipsychrobacter sp.]